jgi:hypothetical protein
MATSGDFLVATDTLTWTSWGRAKSQHASQQSRPIVSRRIPTHFPAYRRHGYFQDKCDKLGLSATLLRIRRLQVRILPSALDESIVIPGQGPKPGGPPK